jgi:tripartite-type tricarboxylate transporter receptor subunit TctC
MNSIKALLAAICLLVAVVSDAAAQSSRPIRFIVPYAAGGAVDSYARALAVPMSKYLNQPVVVENLGGAGGNIGVARVAKAAPDGETLLYHNMAMATNPSLYHKLDYNPLTDFEYVGVAAHSTMVMVARRDLPVKDLKEFIPYARANGDKITIGDGGIGGPTNLCALLFMSAIGTKFTSVSYKGDAPAMMAIMGEQLDLVCDGTATASEHIRAGKVKALGVSSRARLPSMPNVPTLAEGGLTGFELTPWSAIYAPKNTPRPVIQRLETALQAALADKTLLAYYDQAGLVPASRELASSAGLEAHLKAEITKWGIVLKKAGVPLN